MTAHVLLNPAARGGRNRALAAPLARHLAEAGVEAAIHETLAPGDAERMAHTFGLGGALVVVAGGDGTVHEAVNGIVGTEGTFVSTGSDLEKQTLTLYREGKAEKITLSGSWFPGGFHGTMGELLSAIEVGRAVEISAQNNLRSLALCFAAVASADRGQPMVPGSVSSVGESSVGESSR